MQIILLENIKKLGKIGDIINVSSGFARNFLIKNKKALYASTQNIDEVNKKKIELNKKDQEVKKEAKKVFEVLNTKIVKINKLVTENNELYGSVKPTEISKIINETIQIEIMPSQIDLESEIKTIGSFKAFVNLHSEIQAKIVIEVEKSKEDKS